MMVTIEKVFKGRGPGVILDASTLAIVRSGPTRQAWVEFVKDGWTYSYDISGSWTNDARGSLVPVIGSRRRMIRSDGPVSQGRGRRTIRVRDEDEVVAVVKTAIN